MCKRHVSIQIVSEVFTHFKKCERQIDMEIASAVMNQTHKGVVISRGMCERYTYIKIISKKLFIRVCFAFTIH